MYYSSSSLTVGRATSQRMLVVGRPTALVCPVVRRHPAFPSDPRPAAPAAAAGPTDEQPPAAADVQAVQPALLGPSMHHMPQLTSKERAALRAHSESLAKAKTLQRLQVGALGITFNVLMAAMDVLLKHEFLRIKLGEGCGLERKQTAALLSELLDAAVIGQVGFTITLYRKQGLPRPDNLAKPSAAVKAA